MATATSTSTSSTTNAATGAFYVSDGQIIDPDGNVFVARGIDVMEGNDPSVSTLQSEFPGSNFVRLAIYDYADPAALESYVNSLTAKGIVVELEDHTNSTGSNAGGSSGTIFTGSELTTELNWYSSIASAFKNNPYVWFGTDNEPSETDASGNTDPAALSTWQQETYNAIRDTGNTSPVLLEANSWGVGNTNVGYSASDYASMTNVVWDIHFYGWLSGYSTDQTTVSQTLSSIASEAQTITSADGTIPVIIGEYGNSTSGITVDANANQVITAVEDSGYGSAAWAWSDGNPGDGLTTGDGSALSAYGEQIAAAIAAKAAADPASSSTGATTASSSDTVVTAGSGGTIIDASGDTWTITSGAIIDENGTAAGYSANVAKIAYVDGAVWQENTSGLWWEWSGSAWSAGSGTSISPLPSTSANDTVVTAGSGGTIVDASGNTWTVTSGATIDENGTAAGYSASVAEIAYVGGSIWQENTSGLWWEWSGTAWSAGSGTSTSPLPSTVSSGSSSGSTGTSTTTVTTASANDTVVTAGSGGTIVDAGGNTWTVTSGATIDENGTAAGDSANVSEIAYVGGSVWQENTSGLWWEWSGSAWSSGSGTSTSPLPSTVSSGTNGTSATSAPTTKADSISVTANGTTTSAIPDGTEVDGDTFAWSGSVVIQATLGATRSSVSFIGSSAIELTGGSGSATITATAGQNVFTDGSGSLVVTGGRGADTYVFGTSSGSLTIHDFSVAKGDTLLIASSLRTSMTEKSDHAGGIILSFGSERIDLRNTSSVPEIRWT